MLLFCGEFMSITAVDFFCAAEEVYGYFFFYDFEKNKKKIYFILKCDRFCDR